ncbi:MAG TPA: hypothetical protein PLW86_13270 [Rhodocyclaceae bacterium]|nr:hypothetical protein [Rhodocyclaceae bacterium]
MKRTLLAALLGLTAAHALAFSFSEEEQKEKSAASARPSGGGGLSATCRQEVKDKTIMVVVGERTARGMNGDQTSYSSHFQAIDRRLKRLGLNTLTQAEMKARVAQAEIDAYLKNDMDAAMNASKKIGANFILRGVISSRTAINPVLRIPEVYISMSFTLTGADGRNISEAAASAESYSGTDTGGMALTLINEQADGVVAKLYNDYCRAAGVGKKKK